MKYVLKITSICVYLFVLVACSGSEGDGAARIVLGTGNSIIELNSLQYQLPFNVQVTTIDGNPAANSVVSIKVENVQYHKGNYVENVDVWNAVIAISCNAEDTNNNGILEAGEDINANGRLDPTNPATISAHPDETPTFDSATQTITTDENGFGYFVLTYPQSEANWVTVKLTATASVSGTESTEVYENNLAVLLDDLSDTGISPPGGVESKYGVATDCANPN